MKVKVWGARGSVPTPGASTNRYGGNTSCLRVTLSDGRLIVLDAGSGIRNLGLRLAGRPRRIDILLTTCTSTISRGLMFFALLFMPDAEIVIWARPTLKCCLERLARYLSPPLTPFHLRELPARLSFRACPRGEWEIGACAHPRSPRRPPRPHPRLPDRRGRHKRQRNRRHPACRARDLGRGVSMNSGSAQAERATRSACGRHLAVGQRRHAEGRAVAREDRLHRRLQEPGHRPSPRAHAQRRR